MIAWRPLFVACAGAFVAALSTSLVAVSVPVMASDLGVTPAEASWVLTVYLLTTSCVLAFAGRAADVLGRKRVYLTGFVFFVSASMMCAGAPTMKALIGARAMQGFGASMLMAVGPAIVTRAVPPERRARGLGIQLAATYVGLTIGPSAGGALAGSIGWHALFVVVAIVGAAAGVIALVVLDPDVPRAPGDPKPSLDVSGALLFALGLGSLLVALHRAGKDGWTGRLPLALGAMAILALYGFVRHGRIHPAPLLPASLLAKPAFALGVLGATLMYLVTFMLAFSLPFYLQHDCGLSPREAGAWMTVQPATMAVVAPASGWLADRLGAKLPATAGMLAIAAGMAVLVASPIAGLALVGLGAGLYVAPNNAVIMGAAPKDRQATAAAMAATARNVGMTCGVAIAASLDHSIGFARTLSVAAALAIAGAVLAFAR